MNNNDKGSYNDKSSSYGVLLTKNRSATIQHRIIRALAIEIYKLMLGIFLPSVCATSM